MSSKRRVRRKSCEGKLRYTLDEAWAAAKRQSRKTQGGLTAYRCKFGRHYHLGHKQVHIQKGAARTSAREVLHPWTHIRKEQ